jgi:uncharacterized protein (DUF1330 family)
MAVYYINTYDIIDVEEFQKYPPKVSPILLKYGAEVLALDTQPICLEGVARKMNAIIKFPSEEAALKCYNDPEYQLIKPLRINSTKNCTIVIVKEYIKQ